ncbi:acyl-CoA dehydratase activase-related protein [Thermoanaerobacterium sp. RBIITD]|uniref:acyl-CoA dehydratase activase-related protein n=1 Tax=Thermoanaerobacterium sp. RBIITD TaxID=1550240 RepID=UPI000BB70BE6|nr:acyl-CoA dehydratase activase-related protein [Thermoanaerobacterium sp. RBIITD]SNX54820.1 Predicted nucleotide-binding protein, sugar kinase/HSP70/actin superfamily [Thermoanaerobacterium sp. RBIITD]
MRKTVGIPKALLYYNFYPMWKVFFEELGAEVVTSRNTCKKIIDDGVKSCVGETCLPVKTYVGHVIDLKEKGVDYIFIPRVISVERKRYLCAKFLGLPDMVKSLVPDLPEIIDMKIDLYRSDNSMQKEVLRIGKKFINDEVKIYNAYFKSLETQNKFESIMKKGLSSKEAINYLEGKNIKVQNSGDLKIALLAHSYDIMDDYICMGIIDRLRKMGAKVTTTSMMDSFKIERGAKKLQKDLFWTYGREIIGAGKYFLEEKEVDGVITVSAFGCGPDSLTDDLLERDYKRNGGIPYMSITIDEHTGEAGITTRLEAFIDLLRWRKGEIIV